MFEDGDGSTDRRRRGIRVLVMATVLWQGALGLTLVVAALITWSYPTLRIPVAAQGVFVAALAVLLYRLIDRLHDVERPDRGHDPDRWTVVVVVAALAAEDRTLLPGGPGGNPQACGFLWTNGDYRRHASAPRSKSRGLLLPSVAWIRSPL